MLAIAAWESSIADYPAGFHQLWNNIRHVYYPPAFGQLWNNIRYIDYPRAFNQLWEYIRHIKADWFTAAGTAAIALFSVTLWRVNRRQVLDARVIQRAYVKISHSPPGVAVDKSGNFWHEASIKNFGQTPARVTDVVMKQVVVPHNEPLPVTPDYTCVDPGPSLGAFLVRDDEFFVPRHYKITSDEMVRVKDHAADLYMIGFVDYIDQFGGRHRGGYARRYYPAIDEMRDEAEADRRKRNNLLVVDRGTYNYDRPRLRGEGKDWSEDI